MDFFDVYALIALGTFYSLLIGKSVLTHRKSGRVVALGQGKNGAARLLEWFFYVGSLVLAYLVVASAFSWPIFGIQNVIVLFSHIAFKAAGFVCLNVGIVFFSFGLAAFKDAFRIGIDSRQNKTLITTGIFAYTRNPLYLAMLLIFFGYFLTTANFFFLGAFGFMTLSFCHQIIKEERLLETLFGEEYLSYKASVPRFIGCRRGGMSR